MHAVQMSAAKREGRRGPAAVTPETPVGHTTQQIFDKVDSLLTGTQRIGSFELVFTVDGGVIKPKKSDGYVALRVRGVCQTVFNYFLIRSESTMPTKRAVMQQIEQYYNRQSDTQVKQVHLNIK